MNKLKKARLKLGLTQADVAKEIGVAVRTYSAWEQYRFPKHHAIAVDKLLELLKIPRSELNNL